MEVEDVLEEDLQECLLFNLPHEILECILSADVLSHHDLISFGQTCHRFRDFVGGNNNLWRECFRKRWPRIFDELNQEKKYIWFKEFKDRTDVRILCQTELQHISRKHYKETEVTRITLHDFLSALKRGDETFMYVIDELYTTVCDGNTDCQLTKRHYAKEMLKVLWNMHLMKEWQQMSVLPVEEQVLEKGAVLLSQGFQVVTLCTYKKLKKNLDSIADLVKSELMKTHRDHPLFRADLSQVHGKTLEESLWSPQHCRDILKALNCVLYDELAFQGNTVDYYSLDNSLIDKVLETRKGIPITLCILYEAVARRLGMKLEGIQHPSHFMLRWKEFPEQPGKQQYTYIDAFNRGKQLSSGMCPRAKASLHSSLVAPPMEVFQRMVRNITNLPTLQNAQNSIVNYSAESFHLATRFWNNPFTSISQAVTLQATCAKLIDKSLHLHPVIDALERLMEHPHQGSGETQELLTLANHKLQEQVELFRSNQIVLLPRLRGPDVQYAVGMIMHHIRYNYKCVIYSWDSLCMAGDAWIQVMGVMELSRQKYQPFYNVLVEDGTIRYAAEENLEPHFGPCRINHPLVGRYFNKYCGSYYEPNDELAVEYPEDRVLLLHREL